MKDVITKNMIFLNQEIKSQEEVFEFLADRLLEEERGTSKEGIIEGFHAREEEFSTAINDGIAIPHCKHTAVTQATVIIIVNNNKILWTDGEEIDLMFALLIPEEQKSQVHIRILAQVAQMLMDDDFVANVRNAKNAEDIYSELGELNHLFEV